MHFSFVSLLRQAFAANQGWPQQWRNPEPKSAYDVVIIGAGGHGLATAYYLAAEHGIRNVAVIERGWLGGGNTGRNTTIVRSNYLWEESAALYDHALDLWQDLSQALNYNVMYSARGVLMLAHTVHDIQVGQRHIHANRSPASTTNGCRRSSARNSARRSISPRTSAIPCSVVRCRGRAASPVTMRWPGAMRARPRHSVSISSRIAK